MKGVLYVGVGFWLARALYLKYSKAQQLQHQKELQKRLDDFLKDQHFTKKERTYHINHILKR